MNKSTLWLAAVTLATTQVSFATQNRITALGGDAVMISNDDTNIDFFPQHINRQNLLRITGISTIGSASPATPTTPPTAGLPNTSGYAIVVGEKGDKWGLFGGTTATSANFLSVYRSLDENSAVKLGVRVGRNSETRTHNGNEATADITEENNSFLTVMIDGTYGRNVDKQEQAIRGYFAYGPGAITAIGAGKIGSPHGTYDNTITAGAATTKTTGDANTFAIGTDAFLRKPIDIAIFKKAFASATVAYASNSASLSTGATKAQDTTSSNFILGGRLFLFDEKQIGEKSRLFYGVGGQGFITRSSVENNLNSSKTTINSLRLTGPQIRIGVETQLKYGTLRFGVNRDFNLLNYSSKNESPASGAANDSNETNSLNISSTGSYSVTTGFGLQYENLKLDIVLNPLFWTTGPQMIFATPGSSGGTSNNIAASADVIYTF